MTDTSADAWVSSTHRPMGFREFVAIVAAIMALNPLAMDLMLPGLPDVAKAFNLSNINHAQAVLSIFLTGFGAGQFDIGPLADRFGRARCLAATILVFSVFTGAAAFAHTVWQLGLFRFLAGIGMDKIYAHEQHMLGYSLERLSEVEGLRIYGPLALDRRGAAVSFTLEGHDADDIVAGAAKAGITIGASDPSSTLIDAELRALPPVVRASPHYYNTEEEIDRLVAHIAGLAR